MLTNAFAAIEIALVADTAETACTYQTPSELPNAFRAGEVPVHVRIGRRTFRAVSWSSDSSGSGWEVIIGTGASDGAVRLVFFPDAEVDEVLVG